MRVAYFADIRFPLERANGIQTMETCHALAARGHAVHLLVRPDTVSPPRDPFTFYASPPQPLLQVERAPVTGPAAARRVGYLACALGRVLGGGPAGVVFTRDLGVASLLLRVPRARRPPLIYESHGYAPTVAAELPRLIATASPPGAAKLARLGRREARVWQRAEGYVTITAGLADDLRRRFGDRVDLCVIPDGARLATVAAAPAAGRPVVMYAGHLYAWKGVDVLLDALQRLPEADGVIIGGQPGEPDLARLTSRAAALGLGTRVRFAGQVAPSAVPALLAQATVLVLPNTPSTISARYTSPLKLFEYMAAGRPIVASDLPAVREVLTDGESALLVPPGDAAALAAGLRQVLAGDALATRLALAARRRAADYSWARRAERLEALFTAVTTRQS